MDLSTVPDPGAPGVSRRPSAGTRPRVPGTAVQAALPFDDEADAPVGYALTASARRLLAPDPLPALRLVRPRLDGQEPSVAIPDPHDIRPARARALRRAGHDPAVIAARLGSTPEEAARWCGDVGPVRRTRPGRRSVATGHASTGEPDGGSAQDRPPTSAATDHVRSGARRAVAARSAADPAFARDLGLIVGGARPSGATVAVTVTHVALAAAVLDRLRAETGLAAHGLRVVLRVGPARSADRARHEWADRLALPLERVAAVRWPLATDPEDIDATLHLVDPEVVAHLRGWMDAVVDGVDRVPLRESS